MGMTIGRADISRCVRDLQFAGDRLTVAGQFEGSSVTAAKALRQQLLGLVDNQDEPVIPVTSDLDDELDGFYRVLSVSASPERRRGYRETGATAGRHDFSVQLERVTGGFAVAPVEIVQLTPGRVTDHTNSDTNSTRYGALAADRDTESQSPFFFGTASSADGDLLILQANTLPDASTLYVHRCFARPERYYWGAATLEVLRDGNWWPVVGRQLPSGVERWRLSNGIVRATLSGSTVGDLVFERWDGSTWDTAGTAQRGYENSGFTQQFFFGAENVDGTVQYLDVVVLRNDPFGVVVRVPQFGGSETYRIQPGRWDIEIALDVQDAQVQAVSFGDPADALSTFSSSYGIIRTTPSDSHRWFVGCDKDVIEDTTNGYIYLNTAAAVMNICAGIAGTAATDADRSISAFLTGSTLRSQVVAR